MARTRSRKPALSPKFSVIIPTLQKSARLWPLVDFYARHPQVGEILVINNALGALSWESPKVQVLQQSENIFVNPAWNLGASLAREDYLCISNDDIAFDATVIDYAAKILDKGRYSLAGPAMSTLNGEDSLLRHRFAVHVKPPFGTLMFMTAESYEPIPSGPLIWGGDNWLFWNREKPPAQIRGIAIHTEMGASSREFDTLPIRQQDQDWWRGRREVIPVRSWHKRARAFRRAQVLSRAAVNKMAAFGRAAHS